MTSQRHGSVWLGVLLATVMIAAVSNGQAPEIVLYNGRIVTVNDRHEIVTAIAIREARIQAVGSDADILALQGPQTKLVDLAGKMVLPGLIDSHVHALGAATYEFDHSIPEMRTIKDVLDYIQARTKVVAAGEPIVLQQVFVTRLQEQRFPTRDELDQVAPDHPVYFRTGPDAALNSLALKDNQIDRDYVPPAGSVIKVEKDPATGEPNGVIRAAGKFIRSPGGARSPSIAEQRSQLRLMLADYNSVGITGIADRNVSPAMLEAYESLRASGDLTCRSFLYWGVDPSGTWEQIEQQVKTAVDHPAHQRNEWVWLRGVKVFLDGGMLTGSAYMREPWGLSQIYAIDDPQYRGILNIPRDRLYDMAKLCLANDLQFTAHAVGDGAVETLIEAYRRVNDQDFAVRSHRPCITHCNFMSAEAIRSMQDLGIVADLQPAWLWLDGKTLRDHFGDRRLEYFQPYRSLIDAGVIVGGGSDHMQKFGSLRAVNPYHPFLGMWIAMTRLPRGSDQPLHLQQAISRIEALRLYTINNAYILHDESQRGSLEPNKLADLIVIDRDFLTCPLDQVKDIQVLQTWVGGKLVYAANR